MSSKKLLLESTDEDDEVCSQGDAEELLLSTQRTQVGELEWRGQRFVLFEGDNLIGKDRVCEVRLDHKSLSGKHAEIIVDAAGEARLRDLRSTNGTYFEHPSGSGQFEKVSIVNNGRLLVSGSHVRFGMVSCSFSLYNSASKAFPVLQETTLIADDTEEDEPSESNALLQAVIEPAVDSDATMEEFDVDEGDPAFDVDANVSFVRVDAGVHQLHPTGSAQMPTQLDESHLDGPQTLLITPLDLDQTLRSHAEDDDLDETMSQDLMEPIVELEDAPPLPAHTVTLVDGAVSDAVKEERQETKAEIDTNNFEASSTEVCAEVATEPIDSVGLRPSTDTTPVATISNPSTENATSVSTVVATELEPIEVQELRPSTKSDPNLSSSMAIVATSAVPTAVAIEPEVESSSSLTKSPIVSFSKSTNERYEHQISEAKELAVNATSRSARKKAGAKDQSVPTLDERDESALRLDSAPAEQPKVALKSNSKQSSSSGRSKRSRADLDAVEIDEQPTPFEKVVKNDLSAQSTSPADVRLDANVQHASCSSSASSASARVHKELLATPIRVLFTKVEESAYSKQLKRIANIEVTADALQATHCITTQELKRTPKLMIALNSCVRFILNEQWIVDSAKAGIALPIVNDAAVDNEDAYLQELRQSPYLIKDKDKETLWNFELAVTLRNIRFQCDGQGQRKALGVFGNAAIFVTKGICGSKAPAADEMQQIVESGQGIWLKNVQDFLSGNVPAAKRARKGGKSLADESSSATADRVLIVVSHESVAKKEIKKDMIELAKQSGAKGIYSIEVIFQAVLGQELDLSRNILEGYAF